MILPISAASIVKQILDNFSSWSSQLPNASKSFIRFSGNTDPQLKIAILNFLNFFECSHKEKHLGLPFCIPKTKIAAFNDLATKMKAKLTGWKAKILSHASRSVLISFVAQTIPSYYMSTFLIPKSISLKLDANFRKF